MELILTAAEDKCTRKAHSRTANMRCLQDPAGEPYKHALVVDDPKTSKGMNAIVRLRISICKLRRPTSTLIASPAGRNPDRNYRELAVTAPYFIDWTRSSFLKQKMCA